MINFFSHSLIPMAITSSDISGGLQADAWQIVLHAGPVVKSVLILLLLLSVCCWGITLYKFLLFRSAFKESEEFLNMFWEKSRMSETYKRAQQLQHSPLAEIFRCGFMELQRFRNLSSQPESSQNTSKTEMIIPSTLGLESIKRALDQASISERARLESYLNILATTGSTAPFIGLFGTVWGIMGAFRQIGIKGATNLATVAPGISEALVATAFGLFAAIPAVVAYNYYINKIKILCTEMDNFSSEFLNIIERHLETRQ